MGLQLHTHIDGFLAVAKRFTFSLHFVARISIKAVTIIIERKGFYSVAKSNAVLHQAPGSIGIQFQLA